MTHHIFIDGAAGTTGLDIRDRLAREVDLTIIDLPDDRRKDARARAEAMNDADIVILCLPDDAAREAVDMVRAAGTRLIDASSAHRTDVRFTYGFAERTSGARAAIAAARWVSNPGCYATGFIALVAPLVARGLIDPAARLTAHGVSGYSGGGKGLIARYTAPGAPAWRGYALTLNHKHVPEMQYHAALSHPPLFAPAVVPAFRGMVVDVPLHRGVGDAPAVALRDALADHYAGEALIHVHDMVPDELLLPVDAPANDRLDIWVASRGDGEQVRLIARLDNLGKGAGGAAVQNLNIMLDRPERTGLRI